MTDSHNTLRDQFIRQGMKELAAKKKTRKPTVPSGKDTRENRDNRDNRDNRGE